MTKGTFTKALAASALMVAFTGAQAATVRPPKAAPRAPTCIGGPNNPAFTSVKQFVAYMKTRTPSRS